MVSLARCSTLTVPISVENAESFCLVRFDVLSRVKDTSRINKMAMENGSVEKLVEWLTKQEGGSMTGTSGTMDTVAPIT